MCSSAQDLAANLNPLLNVLSFICGNIIPNGLEEGVLLQDIFELSAFCFEEIVGFSKPCAKLFASNAANSALNGCTESCQAYIEPCLQSTCGYGGIQWPTTLPPYGLPDASDINCLRINAQQIGACATFGFPQAQKDGIFDPPGTCNLNTCLSCDEEKSGPIFAQFAGRTRRSSGIVTVTPAGSAFVGLKRECDTVANTDAGLCGTSITDYIYGLIEI